MALSTTENTTNHTDAAAPPAAPHNLVIEADYTGLTLDWEQEGTVDGWTVYCDPLDGTDTVSDYTTEPYYRFSDLAPGSHHVGVVAWRDGQPNLGDGVWEYGHVLGLADGQPNIPVITDVEAGSVSLRIAWISQDAQTWEVVLLDDFGAEQTRQEGVTDRSVTFTGLAPDCGYGMRVRAIAVDGTPSPWTDFYWTQTDSAPAVPAPRVANQD